MALADVILGSYRSPLGKVGEVADRLILRTLARSTVRHFLGELAEVAMHMGTAPSAQQPKIAFLEPEQPWECTYRTFVHRSR